MEDEDVCRVCRAEGAPDNALFHPCACAGSIKFVHQACLVRWLKHSRKEYCELCNHRFFFRPIYAADTPSRLPLREVVFGVVRSAVSLTLRTLPPLGIWAVYIPLLAANAYRYRAKPDAAGDGDDFLNSVPILSDFIRLLTGFVTLRPYPDWSLPALTNSITIGMLVMIFAVVCFCLLFIFLPLLELYGGEWLVVNHGQIGNGLRGILRRRRGHRREEPLFEGQHIPPDPAPEEEDVPRLGDADNDDLGVDVEDNEDDFLMTSSDDTDDDDDDFAHDDDDEVVEARARLAPAHRHDLVAQAGLDGHDGAAAHRLEDVEDGAEPAAAAAGAIAAAVDVAAEPERHRAARDAAIVGEVVRTLTEIAGREEDRIWNAIHEARVPEQPDARLGGGAGGLVGLDAVEQAQAAANHPSPQNPLLFPNDAAAAAAAAPVGDRVPFYQNTPAGAVPDPALAAAALRDHADAVGRADPAPRHGARDRDDVAAPAVRLPHFQHGLGGLAPWNQDGADAYDYGAEDDPGEDDDGSEDDDEAPAGNDIMRDSDDDDDLDEVVDDEPRPMLGDDPPLVEIADDLPIENNIMNFLERDQAGRAGGAANAEDGNVNVHRIFRLLGFEGGGEFLFFALLFYFFITISLDAVAAPLRVGKFIVYQLNMTSTLRACWLEGTVPLALGYVPICFLAFLANTVSRWLRIRHFTWFFGVVYLSCKVIVLLLVELGIFPQLCGFWLHICCLGMLGDASDSMDKSYVSSPTSFCFIHWILGMEFLYFFASLVIVSRKILRPGVLWFFRNLNDPNFHPMQEIMMAPVMVQMRHFMTSSVFLGSCIMLISWIPIRIIKYLLPTFLPYTLMEEKPAEVQALYVDVSVLHFILAIVFDNQHTRFMIHGFIYAWCHAASWLLGLRSYLLGQEVVVDDVHAPAPPPPPADGQENPENPAGDDVVDPAGEVNLQPQVVEGGEAPLPPDEVPAAPAPAPVLPAVRAAPAAAAAAAGRPPVFQRIHDLVRQEDAFREREDFDRPPLFTLRIVGLVLLLVSSVVALSIAMISLPALTGRFLLRTLFSSTTKRFEGYTVSFGFQALWLMSKLVYELVVAVYQHGLFGVKQLLALAVVSKIVRCTFFLFLTFGVLSLLVGLSLSLTVMPLVIAPYQTPTFPFHYALVFIFGFGLTNFAVTFLIFAHLDAVDGGLLDHRNMFLHVLHIITASEVVRKHITGAVLALLAYICVPYTVIFLVLDILGASYEAQVFAFTYVYFAMASLTVLVLCTITAARSLHKACKTLHSNMRKEKYLNGFQLMNYYPQAARPNAAAV